tara:strand:- start:76 stop:318 length:243 start_codon:yes stop_codon:yes gene_type:complete
MATLLLVLVHQFYSLLLFSEIFLKTNIPSESNLWLTMGKQRGAYPGKMTARELAYYDSAVVLNTVPDGETVLESRLVLYD